MVLELLFLKIHSEGALHKIIHTCATILLIPALNEGKWLASGPSRFTSDKAPQHPLYTVRVPQSLSGRAEDTNSLSLPGKEPPFPCNPSRVCH